MQFPRPNFYHLMLHNKGIKNDDNRIFLHLPEKEDFEEIITEPIDDDIGWYLYNTPDSIQLDNETDEWCIVIKNIVYHTGFKINNYTMYMTYDDDNEVYLIALKLV